MNDKNVSLHPLIVDYCESLYDAQMATKKIRRADMRTICDTWTQRHGTLLDPTTLTETQARAIVADLVEVQQRGPVGLDRIIQTGRSCWVWLVAEGQAQTNPFAALPLRDARERRQRKAVAPGSSIALCVLRAQLCAAALPEYHTLAVVLHLLQGGVRPTEITAIQAEDVDRAVGQITVRNAYGTARRTVPLSAEACAAIDAYCLAIELPTAPHTALIGQYRGGRWQELSISTLQRRFRELCKRAAAEIDITCADIAHPLARTALQRVAASIADIQMDQLRW